MNRLMVFNTVGRILRAGGALLLLPAIVSLIYGEYRCLVGFFVGAVIGFQDSTLFTMNHFHRLPFGNSNGFPLSQIIYLLLF